MSKITVLTPRSSFLDSAVEAKGRGGLVAKLLNRIANWRRRGRINQLSDLDDRMLDDIGVTRHDLTWAKGLPLEFNPLTAIEERTRTRARHRRLSARKALPGSPRIYPISPNRIGCV